MSSPVITDCGVRLWALFPEPSELSCAFAVIAFRRKHNAGHPSLQGLAHEAYLGLARNHNRFARYKTLVKTVIVGRHFHELGKRCRPLQIPHNDGFAPTVIVGYLQTASAFTQVPNVSSDNDGFK